jgi:hypothetical protein
MMKKGKGMRIRGEEYKGRSMRVLITGGKFTKEVILRVFLFVYLFGFAYPRVVGIGHYFLIA